MIGTDRLLIRPWREADRAPYAAICRDPRVMEFLGPIPSREECDAAIDRMAALQDGVGYCFWAVERRTDGAFLGFCGLKPGKWPIKGEVEIGWRLGSDHWGQGYALEAAAGCLDWGWRRLGALEIVAITVPANRRSWGLMERLGMMRDRQGDFDHPDLPEGSPLRPHVTYRIARPSH